MTKADIVEKVYEKIGFSKKESSELVELVFDTMKATLERSEKIKISGFGNFVVRQRRKSASGEILRRGVKSRSVPVKC